MKQKLTIFLSLILLSLTSSCGSKKEEQNYSNIYEIDDVTFYEGNEYFLSKALEYSIYNEKENSLDIGNLTGSFDFKHYAFIKDNLVCIGEFDSDFDTHTKNVYSSTLTVKDYCIRELEEYDVMYVGPYLRCYKEGSKYIVFSYPLNSNKEKLYDGNEETFYLPEGSELKYFEDSKIPYGVNSFSKKETIEIMETYLKAIFINYDTKNYKKIVIPRDDKKKENNNESNIIELCLRLDEIDKDIL